MLAIRLPEQIEKRLDDLARETGRSKTYYAREAILEYMDDLEDYYLADQRMQKFSEAKAIPLAKAMKKYGVAD